MTAVTTQDFKDAYWNGYGDFWTGVLIEECPFEMQGTEAILRECWVKGWASAFNDRTVIPDKV